MCGGEQVAVGSLRVSRVQVAGGPVRVAGGPAFHRLVASRAIRASAAIARLVSRRSCPSLRVTALAPSHPARLEFRGPPPPSRRRRRRQRRRASGNRGSETAAAAAGRGSGWADAWLRAIGWPGAGHAATERGR